MWPMQSRAARREPAVSRSVHPALASSRPLVFAHRGGAALAPENTMAAFEHASALGVDGFELDVQLSRDGVAMVHHDATVDRTTDGTGAVADLTASDLMALDAGYRFGVGAGYPWRGRAGGVPRLRDALTRFPRHRFIIEIKGLNGALTDAVIDDVHAAGAIDRVSVGGFAARQMWRARRREPRLATGAAYEETRWALYRTWVRWPASRQLYHVFHVPELAGATRVVSPRFVAAAHAAGVRVYVWTVDAPDDIRRLLSWGVDGIITDRPDVAVPLVADTSA
jgi:glycerophosphoryl diester phosphodiesterase